MPKLIKYMITDPLYSPDKIKNSILKHRPDFVCYRNKTYFDKKEILEFLEFAKKYSNPVINFDTVKNNPSILEYFESVHLPSSRLKQIDDFKNKTVFASTHTIEEVKKAVNADYITFSPIFDSKGRKGLGIEKLNEICNIHPKVIALGGIVSNREVEEIKKSKAAGFASIRYFFT